MEMLWAWATEASEASGAARAISSDSVTEWLSDRVEEEDAEDAEGESVEEGAEARDGALVGKQPVARGAGVGAT